MVRGKKIEFLDREGSRLSIQQAADRIGCFHTAIRQAIQVAASKGADTATVKGFTFRVHEPTPPPEPTPPREPDAPIIMPRPTYFPSRKTLISS